MANSLKTGMVALLLTGLWAAAPEAGASTQTYLVSEVGLTSPSVESAVATGINRSNLISGYSKRIGGEVRGWRGQVGAPAVDLGSFGGLETRATGLNDAGQVTGHSMDQQGRVHGFLWKDGTLSEIVDPASADSQVFPQSVNSAGRVGGYVVAGDNAERPFVFTLTEGMNFPGTLGLPASPLTAAAYGVTEGGKLIGIASWPDGFDRAFRSGLQNTFEDLGTLGGDESWAHAVNQAGQIVGSASAVTSDTHAFLFTEGLGMRDLGTLGGYTSQAYALNGQGDVVGSAENSTRALHAFIWSDSLGMRDLNQLVPADAGWELIEARGINDSGVIVGNGRFHGTPRAFALTPFSGLDTMPPVALLQAGDLTNVQYSAFLFDVVFWDHSGVMASSVSSNCIRVTGPNGFDQLAQLSGLPPSADGLSVAAFFYLTPPSGVWKGMDNGVYTVSLEPGQVSDLKGNTSAGGPIGTFRVATETRPVARVDVLASPVMGRPTEFVLSAISSFPYSANDRFDLTIDWENDGRELQTVSATNGVVVAHAFSSIGAHTVRLVAVDPHGVSSGESFTPILVVNPPPATQWTATSSLTGSRRLAVGVAAGDSILCIGGLPLKSGVLQAQSLAMGAASFVDGRRFTAETVGIGAGYDALNRVVIYGGIEPNSATPNVNAYVYSPSSGVGGALPAKRVAVHDFGFCEDQLHRLYTIGGATRAGISSGTDAVERFDALANAWMTLAPLPAPRIGATACADGLGHILAMGGVDPTSGQPTSSVYSYDIGNDSWTQLGDVPAGSSGTGGRVAALGADGMVYVIGGINSFGLPGSDVMVFDPLRKLWYAGPSLATGRGTPAVALGKDGFLYVMGGDGPPKGGGGGGNNGLSSVERLDTKSLQPPRILSNPLSSVLAGNLFGYQLIAAGNPRPSYSLVRSPEGMSLDDLNSVVRWNTPANQQPGDYEVLIRAVNVAGVAEQRFHVTVLPLPPADTVAPTPPTNFFPAFRTSTNITFTWSGATDNVGVVSYNIYNLQGSRSRRWVLVGHGITNRSFITAAGAYAPSFAVAAVDAVGNVSAMKIGSANSLTLPLIAHVNLSEPSTVIQGSAFLFTLTATGVPTPGFSQLSGPSGMTLTRVPGPNPLQDYAVVQWQPEARHVGTNVFTVYATNANTTGGSQRFTVVVLPGGTDLVAPSPVARLTADQISYDRCLLNWTPAGDNVGIDHYALRAVHFANPSSQVIMVQVPGDSTQLTLGGLLPASGYTVSITPVDAAGNVGGATSVFLTTLPLPDLSLRVQPGDAPGGWMLARVGGVPGALFTIESSDSLASPNWQPVEPRDQWPAAGATWKLAPGLDVAHRFYRIIATP